MSFDTSRLAEIQTKAQIIWQDSQALQMPIFSDAAQAVLENQTVQFEELNDRDKDRKIKVHWIVDCEDTVKDCTPSCTLDMPEASTDVQEYEPNFCFEDGFKVNETDLRTSIFTVEETIARKLNGVLKRLDEKLSRTVLTSLKGFAGDNTNPSPYTYDRPNKTTIIPDAKFNASMVANLIQQSMLNQLVNPYYINDGTLFVEWLNKQFEAGNLDGAGNAQRVQALKMYYDQMNFAKAGVTDNLFAIDASAVALKTVNKFNDEIREMPHINQTRYTVDSLSLPGVKYDLTYQMNCDLTGGRENDYHQFRVRANGLVALNPAGCPVVTGTGETAQTFNRTGVLAFKKGA